MLRAHHHGAWSRRVTGIERPGAARSAPSAIVADTHHGPQRPPRAASAPQGRPRAATTRVRRGAGQVVANTRARGGGGLSVGCIGLWSVGTHTTTGSVKSRRVSLGARAFRPSRRPSGGCRDGRDARASRTIHESCVGLSTPCCLVCIHTTLRAE